MGLQTAGRIDDCSYWITRVSFISVSLAVVLIYPRMMAVHTLLSEEAGGSLTTPIIPLTASACVLKPCPEKQHSIKTEYIAERALTCKMKCRFRYVACVNQTLTVMYKSVDVLSLEQTEL